MRKNLFVRFGNQELRNKLIISIISIIIIPLLIIGAGISIYMISVIRGNVCDERMDAVSSGLSSIETYIGRTQEVSKEAGENSSVARVIKDTAFVRDYVITGQWLENILRKNPGYKNISISDGKEIFMQRGTYIDSEDNKAVQGLVENNVQEIWTLPRKLNISPYVLTKAYTSPVLTYYAEISEYYGWGQGSSVISVSVSEEELCERYIGYLGSDFTDCGLVRADGTILSATEKEQLGTAYEKHGKVMDQLTESRRGFWKEGGKYYFYLWSSSMQFYVIGVVPATVIELSLQPIWMIIAAALFLCFLFGAAFVCVQQRCIIQPLNQLLKNIQSVQNGNFEIVEQQFNEDEIGRLSREFEEMSRQLEKMVKEVYLSKINEQEAEIQVLMSQINPHFLYNTLDSIHWKAVKCRAYDVADQIEALSEMYKYILSKGQKMITLKEELRFLENYFYILKARYGKRVEFDLHVDNECAEVQLPKLILQPLIENAVLHGLEPSDSGGTVQIEAYREGKELILSVEDNGKGTDGKMLMEKIRMQKQDGEALALKNIDMRLRLHYGQEYGIQIVSEPDKGCRVIMRIPYR